MEREMEKLTRIFGSIVPTFFATANGVTLSEVARIQAENKQQNDKFWSDVSDAVTGIFQKVITYLGSGEASRTIKASTITVDKIGEYIGGGRAQRPDRNADARCEAVQAFADGLGGGRSATACCGIFVHSSHSSVAGQAQFDLRD